MIFLGLAISFGVLMHVNLTKLKLNSVRVPTVEAVDAILPQTQCRQCGYSGCKPYALAIINGEADINQCPPGGAAGVNQLAKLMGVQYKQLNPKHGAEKPKAVAFIVEEACIGCTLCIQACPVDAILGASKMMHTVISQECTGCELCLPPCPMDCLIMEPINQAPKSIKPQLSKPKNALMKQTDQQIIESLETKETRELRELREPKKTSNLARERYNFRLFRLEREKQEISQKQLERSALIKANAAKALQSVVKNAAPQSIVTEHKHE